MTNTYEIYKDSNVAWLDKVPSNWSIEKGKHVLRVLSKPVQETDEVITCFRDGEVILRSERRTDGFTMSDKEIGYQHIDKGDLVIHGMDGFAGSMGISKSTGKGSPVLIVCNPIKDDPNYLMYYLRILASTNVFLALSTGIRERSCDLKWNKISVLPFSIPTVEEQKSIASFLDTKCNEIDTLISLQEDMISELQAYKKSIITEVVTKGVDPNVKMKNSGIDWIEEIPENYNIRKFHQICKVITDYVASGSFADIRENVQYLDEPDYAMLVRTTDLAKTARSAGKVYISKKSYEFLSNSNLFGGEIVLPNIGSIGDVYVVPTDLYEHMSLAPNSIMFLTNMCDKFYYYYFSSMVGNRQLKQISESTAMAKFNKTDLRQLKVLCPPIHEQEKIVSYLDKKLAEIDSLISLKQEKIQELKDYKKSVIYEYVTGKKRV